MKTHQLLAIALLSFAAGASLGAICGQTATKSARDAAQSSAVALDAATATAKVLSATTFDEFPILWLGTSYDSDGDGVGDMPLSSAYATHGRALIDPRNGNVIIPARTSFGFGYGTCVISPNRQDCPVPITIVFYPSDGQSSLPAESLDAQDRVRVRGVDASINNRGPLRVDTADFTILISPSFARTENERLGQALRIANTLVGANAKAARFTKGTDFRPKGAAPLSGSSCCSLQLDMDPATAGVQSVRSVSGPQDISIDVVLGDSVGDLGAFDMSLVYDDTRLTPGAAGSGGLNGNPDFNESALGGTWNCALGGSPSADTDAATGPGHGVAFLSCFTTAAGSDIAAATVIATLRLHVAASGTSSIAIGNAHFAHYDTTDIGTCDATGGGTMTCAGGSVTAP